MNGVTEIGSPLPQRFASAGEALPGSIKQRAEDFLVDELPLYDPSGHGEHLYLGIEKTSVSHSELVSSLSRHFNVSQRAIGFAGMKDKAAVTRQTISVHLLRDPGPIEPWHDRIRVLWSARHTNKIRRGHLAGNRFSIRIRDVEPTRAPLIHERLRALERGGTPNYFGSQRFGYRANNHLLGAATLRGAWGDLLEELVGPDGSPYPEYQAERRELYREGRFAEALGQWSSPDRAERQVLRALARNADQKRACAAIGHTTLSFFVNAFQSVIFNRVIDDRLDGDGIEVLLEGDLAILHRHDRAVFPVTSDELANGELPGRLERLEISPSGPLWGTGMRRASGAIDDAEGAALASTGFDLEEILASPYGPAGSRRPLRCPVRHTETEAGVDEHGGYIRVAFDLPRGAYATIVLRELLRGEG